MRPARGPAALAVVVGGVFAFLFASGSLGLVREALHFNCSWGTGGEWGPEGTWLCADGVGYLGVAVVLGGMSGMLLLAGLLVAFARPSAVRSIVYLVLAAISLAWIGMWTFYAATAYSGPRPDGETGVGLWIATVLPGLTTCAFALVMGAVGTLTAHRWSPVVLWVGVGLTLVGTALAPGIGVATIVSGAMLVAAGLDRHGSPLATRVKPRRAR